MQTIARANRVAEGKSNGLVIDYIGIVKALKKALNDYTQNRGGTTKIDPTINKEEMIEQIDKAIADADQLLLDNDFDLSELVGAEKFRKLQLLADGAEAMCSSAEVKNLMKPILMKSVEWLSISIEMISRRIFAEKLMLFCLDSQTIITRNPHKASVVRRQVQYTDLAAF